MRSRTRRRPRGALTGPPGSITSRRGAPRRAPLPAASGPGSAAPRGAPPAGPAATRGGATVPEDRASRRRSASRRVRARRASRLRCGSPSPSRVVAARHRRVGRSTWERDRRRSVSVAALEGTAADVDPAPGRPRDHPARWCTRCGGGTDLVAACSGISVARHTSRWRRAVAPPRSRGVPRRLPHVTSHVTACRPGGPLALHLHATGLHGRCRGRSRFRSARSRPARCTLRPSRTPCPGGADNPQRSHSLCTCRPQPVPS